MHTIESNIMVLLVEYLKTILSVIASMKKREKCQRVTPHAALRCFHKHKCKHKRSVVIRSEASVPSTCQQHIACIFLTTARITNLLLDLHHSQYPYPQRCENSDF